MAVWLGGLTRSATVNYDTRKWSRFTGTGASGTIASIVNNTELDMSQVGGTTTTAETLFTLTPNAGISSWVGAVRFTANVPGSDTATQQFNSTLWLCHDGTVSTTGVAANGYSLNFTTAGAQLRKTVASTTTVLGTNATFDPTKKYRLRFERTSSAIRARIWEYAATEPTDWNVYTGALDGSITAGRGAVSQFRYRTTKAGALWSEMTFSGPGVRPYDAPLNFRTFDGRVVAKGRSRSVMSCGMLDSTLPSGITSTATTYDATTLRRTLTATANSSVTITFPAITATAIEYAQLDVENVAFDANTGVTYQLGFLGGSITPLVLEENQSYGAARFVVSAATRDLKAQVFATNTNPATQEQSNHRNLRVSLIPRAAQLQAGEGESGLFGGGWYNTTQITGTITPTITLTATGANARSMSFTRIALTIESL